MLTLKAICTVVDHKTYFSKTKNQEVAYKEFVFMSDDGRDVYAITEYDLRGFEPKVQDRVELYVQPYYDERNKTIKYKSMLVAKPVDDKKKT